MFCSLRDRIADNYSAVAFCHEDVRLNLEKFLNDLKSFNFSEVKHSFLKCCVDVVFLCGFLDT